MKGECKWWVLIVFYDIFYEIDVIQYVNHEGWYIN